MESTLRELDCTNGLEYTGQDQGNRTEQEAAVRERLGREQHIDRAVALQHGEEGLHPTHLLAFDFGLDHVALLVVDQHRPALAGNCDSVHLPDVLGDVA